MNQYQDIYNKTLEIGKKKLAEGSEDGKVLGPRIGTGGGFAGIFLWDTAFSIFWMRYHQDLFPCTDSLDNFYRLQTEDGCIHREYDKEGVPVWPHNHPITFAPPLLAWAEIGLHEISGDTQRLEKVYPNLKAHFDWCKRTWQKENGLYMGDGLGCGMDNLARYPINFQGSNKALKIDRSLMAPAYRESKVEDWYAGEGLGSQWNQQGSYIDMSAQVAFNATNLAQICELIENKDQSLWRDEAEELKARIHEKCWSEEMAFYFDLDENDGYIERYHIGGFWPLIAKICPKENVDAYLQHLNNEKKFKRPFPVPSLAADEPDYLAGGKYWRGSSWPCTTYMVLKGLRAYGKEEMARDIASTYLTHLQTIFEKTDTIWENNAPETIEPGSMSGKDFCGWGGLGPVAITREFLS